MSTDPKPKRRPRYSGRHPRRFEDKYKEHSPDLYPQDVQHIRAKGRTVAGTHTPIMAEEVLKALRVDKAVKGVDATLGYGGHAQLILERTSAQLVGLDRDGAQLEKTTTRLRAAGFEEARLMTHHRNYSDVSAVVSGADFIFADLGLSSMQIDDPARGFSHKFDGPLDLRMDTTGTTPTAADLLRELTKERLAELLIQNADEPNARVLSRYILEYGPIKTTQDLRKAVQGAVKRLPSTAIERDESKSIKRVFQALRIEVNKEFDHLQKFLDAVPKALKAGGRVVILTFHSGEDRRVKKSFEQHLKAGVYREITTDVTRPTAEEIHANPRAKPAKLRWAIRA